MEPQRNEKPISVGEWVLNIFITAIPGLTDAELKSIHIHVSWAQEKGVGPLHAEPEEGGLASLAGG